MDRRRFLAGVAGVAGVAALAQLPADRAAAAPRPAGGDYPFTLGVASGDPTATGAVLWTRLAPKPFEPGGGMPSRRVGVRWEIARDERFRRVVRSGTAWALPELSHAVHVDVEGLESDREWFYRFRYRDDVSMVGRTRTAPRETATVAGLAFAFASCQRWDEGYFPSYAHLAREDLDLVLHLGDYVYEYGIPADGGYRRTPVPEQLRPAPRSLDQWRMRYALVKSDPQLQAAHLAFPWMVTWDDHEVQNDYANTQSQYEGDITALRVAAYQAWYEHQPVRVARPGAGGLRIYRRLRWGRLAQLDLVDGRQYRSVPPSGWGEAPAGPEQNDPSVTMLGAAQERWLYDGFARTSSRWNILGSNVMMGRLDHDGDAGDMLWHDAWDGFPAARRRLTDAWVRHGVPNPVVVTGDWHSTFVNDIHRDFDTPGSPVVATEFVGTSISSNGDGEVYGPYYGPMIKYNPHIRFFDGDRRGYVKCRVTPREMCAELRMVDTVGRRDAAESTLAAFAVENGRPGAHRI
ncbi:alkaline phosphatase D family protein [Micromonospora sp. WMMD812]|uniref:alkaline phosphatase D family protein n=1 Tax=Micromonospora sp. WMMD812 TaxID=3015152 RepID=UPI00248B16C9|nr:alkaline phosphatase D family protein [Micromonospora sp. WMMD812]WBB66157.1 alkaline phosphatase D family protein [Micromonospora sp. WMMD812]